MRVFLLLFACFSTVLATAQPGWLILLGKSDAQTVGSVYESLIINNQSSIRDLKKLENGVKILNNYLIVHLDELNTHFKNKVSESIFLGDQFISHSGDTGWYVTQFRKMVENMPYFQIQQQLNRYQEPYDTIFIDVPGMNKQVKAIINNKVLEEFVLASAQNRDLLADKDLRNLDKESILAIVENYRYDSPIEDTNAEGDHLLVDNSYSQSSESTVDDQSTEESLQEEVSAVESISLNDGSSFANEEETSSEKRSEQKPEIQPESKNDPREETKRSNSIVAKKAKTETIREQQKHASQTKSIYNNSSLLRKSSAGIVYRIQIAASRNELDDTRLRHRYSGAREIKRFQEEGWNKYFVAETDNLEMAKSIALEPEMPKDAFIMAYKNGQKAPKILYGRDANNNSSIESGTILELSRKNRVYAVQIAASQQPLSNEDIRKKYNGDMPIDKVEAGEWYRYSIGRFYDINGAAELMNNCNIPDAFVASYSKGVRKIHKMQVIKSNSKVEHSASEIPKAHFSGKVTYVVQIAAAMRPLSKEEIRERYKGQMEVREQSEDDFYKYVFGNYSSFYDAWEAKKECGVYDAFVKAYKDGVKINLFEAKEIQDKQQLK